MERIVPSSIDLKKLKEVVQQGPADVIIGKKGLYKGVLEEIKRRLKEKEVIKVRVLKSALKVTGLDRKAIAREVAKRVGAVLLDIRGRTFVLYRPGKKGRGEDKTPGMHERRRRARTWSQRSKSQQTS